LEIPNISIPEIKINVPQHNPYQVLNVPLPSIKLPGCFKYHRDASPKNTALYDDDPTGTTISCPYGFMPTFQPMLYDKRKIEIVETKGQEKRVENTEAPAQKEIKPEIPKEEKKIEYEPCPPKGALRVGSYVNEKRLEIIKSYTRNENNECITNYESVSFVDSVLPSPSAALNVVTISLLAASSPLLLGLLKSISKTVFKKAITKKNKTNSE
tara:strand:- start:1516 stop:2151 length:636 start_codon:yes stop_codon:yes gene_type:complete